MRFSRAEVTTNYAILTLFAAIAVFPVANVLLIAINADPFPAGLAIPTAFTTANFRQAWTTTSFGSAYVSSGIIAVGVVGIGTVCSVLAGYAFGTMRFAGQRALFLFFLLGLIVPTEGILIPLYYDLRSLHLTDTYWSVIL